MGISPRIAIDAMGGDVGPSVMLAGAARAHARRDDLHFLLFGDGSAIQAELGGDGARLRLYPDPNADLLKQAVARRYGATPDQVFVGNGSDEVLAHAFQALLKHEAPILFPDITYSFYPVYCGLYGVDYRTVYSARRAMGGGVTIDLIHEWDYLVDLFGRPQEVYNFKGTYSELEIDSDDLSVYIARWPRLQQGGGGALGDRRRGIHPVRRA